MNSTLTFSFGHLHECVLLLNVIENTGFFYLLIYLFYGLNNRVQYIFK